MKNILLSLLVVIAVTIALTRSLPAQAECPSADRFFCSQYALAEQEYASAQAGLGFMYNFGLGIAEDKREAVGWYRKAAEQGDAPAQYALGMMYAEGGGIAVDKREAVGWFRKAAEQGHAKAQYILGLMYAEGEGVITDYRGAYIWFSIAKANSDEGVADILDKLDFSAYLTTAEIKSARREAAQRLKAIDQRHCVIYRATQSEFLNI